MAEITLEDVAENAGKPAQTTVTPTSTTVQQHSLKDQADIADRITAKNALSLDGFGLGFRRLKPGGCG